MTKEAERQEIPADLAELDEAALNALAEGLTADFDKLLDEGSRDVAAMTALADDITRIKGEVTARAEAEAEADAAIAALADRVRGANDEASPEPEPEPEPVDPDEPVEPEATVESEPVPVEPEKELVTAAATRTPALSAIASRAPRPRVDSKRTATIAVTASADLPGVKPGSNLTMEQLSEAMHDRARTLSDDGKRAPVARIEIPHTHRLGTDPTANARTIEDLIGQPDATALVASGGWCAPSQPLFELFDLGPDTSDLFDLPGLGTDIRAGVLVPSFYTMADAEDALWTWTEADDIAAAVDGGPTKPCLKIPCPTWTEARLEAEGLCVTHGNLSDRAWPELTKQFLSIVMGAHQRRISSAKIAKVLNGLTVVAPGAGMTPSDAAGDLLNVVTLAAADMRSQYRVGKSRSIDVLFPAWVREVLRSTMAMRQGIYDAMNVSDAQVTSWLSARGIRAQFTPDWQPLYGAAPATAWPANVTFAMWFTGAYVSIDGGSIDLGVVRDSTLNETNDFTAAWSEQFYQVVRRGPLGRSYTVPLGVDGVTGCCATV